MSRRAITKLAILSLFLAATNGIITFDNYEVVTKYNCGTKEKIFLDRGLILRFEGNFLNNMPGRNDFRCELEVSNTYKIPRTILILQHLKFRKGGYNCIDTIKEPFISNGRCGEMIMGQMFHNSETSWNRTTFISDFAGPPLSYPTLPLGAYFGHSLLSLNIHVDKRPLQLGERLAFILSATGFVECDGLNVPKGLFNCGYGVCILEMFVGDGVVNCPFGDCRDEGNCSMALEDLIVLTNGTFTENPIIKNSTVALPTTSRPFLEWLQKKEARNRKLEQDELQFQPDEWQKNVTQELKCIKEEVKKNTEYLERILEDRRLYLPRRSRAI